MYFLNIEEPSVCLVCVIYEGGQEGHAPNDWVEDLAQHLKAAGHGLADIVYVNNDRNLSQTVTTTAEIGEVDIIIVVNGKNTLSNDLPPSVSLSDGDCNDGHASHLIYDQAFGFVSIINLREINEAHLAVKVNEGEASSYT